ncbi:flagellar hook-length control protein FliK [Sulfuriflexus sp.]|uniref:flagellar hook-length control protein FliK n=1 Tax=Sulfuriflexus sp. TaxID=2015443 RepID=UPI0028CF744E|nr:flagellar hook-length control protein FliK [Sulfuriflexus sp.]MDT8403925.1 flagellar hook-length control protein FliK [Sulfuriflexus sp.]
MSDQLPLKVAPSPAPGNHKAPASVLKSDVSADKKSQFGGVLSSQVQQQGKENTGPVAADSKLSPVTAKAGLPQDGKALPLPLPESAEQLEGLLGDADLELATEALEVSAEASLETEIVPEGDESIALASPVVVVDSRPVAPGRPETGTDKTTPPPTLAETLARLAPVSPAIEGEAAADTAQAQAALQLQAAESREGKVISLVSRGDTEKPPLQMAQANKLIEQFTEFNGRQTTATNLASPVSAGSPVTTSGTATTSATGLQQVSIDVPVQHQQWQRAFAERVVWSVGNNQSVQVRVNPAELGPIDIQVNVSKEQTNITFNTVHATTRETIELAIPRLREMLANEGLNLGDVDVRHQDSSAGGQAAAHDQGNGTERNAGPGNLESLAEGHAEVMLHPVMISERAVDYYI